MKKGETDKTPVSVTASEASQKGRRSGDTGKLQADSTTYPTLSTKPSENVKINENGSPNCGCPNKRDAFFDKLLNYLEKQSEVISRCCFNEKGPVRNKRSNTDPVFNKEESPCLNKEESPFSNNNTSASDKSKPKASRSDDKLSRIHKPKDNECKIIVEVCTCDKDKKSIKPSPSTKSLKSSSQNPPRNNQTQRNIANEIDCSGCEKKVENFFKLAEEICQAYIKRCLTNDDLNNIPSYSSEQNVRIEELDGMNAPRGQRRGQEDPCQERADNRDVRGCNSLAVEIECHGDREEFVIQPCDCVRKSGRAPSHYRSRMSQDETGGNQGPKKSCIELFEERYGKILRDLHSKLIKHNPPPGMAYGNQPPPPRAQQQYPSSQQPTYPPPQQQQQPQPRSESKQPQNAVQPVQYPPYQNPYQQPQPNSQYQPYPPGQPPYYGQMPDGVPPAGPAVQEQNERPSKSSNKGKKKKKSS